MKIIKFCELNNCLLNLLEFCELLLLAKKEKSSAIPNHKEH